MSPRRELTLLDLDQAADAMLAEGNSEGVERACKFMGLLCGSALVETSCRVYMTAEGRLEADLWGRTWDEPALDEMLAAAKQGGAR